MMRGRSRAFVMRGFALRWHLLALTAATLLPTAIFGGMLLQRIAYDEQGAMERRLAQDAEMLGATVDRELMATLRAIETLARSAALDRDDLVDFRRDAVRATATNPAWLAIALFTPDGARIVDTRDDAPPSPSMEPHSLERALRTKRPVVGEVMLAVDGRTRSFPIRVPVLREGEVRYVVTAVVSAAHIGDAIATGTRSDVEWTRVVVDGSGAIVARTRDPEEFVGRKASREFLGRTAGGGTGVFRYRTADGMDAFVAFARAPLSGWTVAVVASAAAVDAPVRRSIQTLVAAAVALLVFSALAAFLSSRRFSAAIGSLMRAAAALPHGGRVEVTPHRITEVSQVGEALDRSARLLEARQREAEENLARAAAARAEAERSNRAKDEFLAMLGHELRNPLSPIVTALQLLRQRGLRWGREHDIISRQVAHLVRLVDDLLDVSRVTRGKIELHPERMELRTAVARAIEMASPVIEERQHRLSVDVPEGLVVRADPARLAQVITNLLTNAARYTPRRGHVGVSARHEADGVSLSVTDDGQGIAPELLPHIFDLFVQGPRARDRAEGGLGIGLALVRTLVGLHGGRVEARSAGPGRGSTFRVVLPDAADVPDRTAAGGAGDPLRRTARPLRILVVDDNADAAMLLTEFLSQVGHDVVPAHDAPAALAAVERFVPDLAILDIGLPVVDGYELAEQLREKLGPSATAFVGLTGYGQASDHARSREAGFVRHFVKPIDPGELLDALEEIAAARPAGAARRAATQAAADAERLSS